MGNQNQRAANLREIARSRSRSIGRSHFKRDAYPACPSCKADETIVLDRLETQAEFVCPNCAHRWTGLIAPKG